MTVLTILVVGALLPFSPLAGNLGFVPLRGNYFAYPASATIVYLFLGEFGKRILFGSRTLSR